MPILPHPHLFLKNLSETEQQQALSELKAILDSNPGPYFNTLSFWYRQTKVPVVRARWKATSGRWF
jgi:hypothetical protein